MTLPDDLAREAMARCDALGACSDEPGRLTRTFLSPAMHRACHLVHGWMEEAGLKAATDAAGNVIGRRGSGPVVLIGSHLDTVANAGRYDGPLGVVAGIAAAKALASEALPFTLAVAGFSEEEGVRFRVPYLGSLAVAGHFDPALLDLRDGSGATVRDAIAAFGLDPAAIPQARIANLSCYLEIHIEQGPVLDGEGLPLAVVTSIIGQERLLVAFEGRAGHAGTTPIDRRRDAAVGAARLILGVRAAALATPDLRATVGAMKLEPNVRNVIAGRAELALDIRHADDSLRRAAAEEILALGRTIAEAEGLCFSVLAHESQLSVPADPGLAALMEQSLADGGHPLRRLPSGAGHDAVAMARACPWAMLFVRNPDGISHHPDEAVAAGDVAAAIDVLIRFLRRYAAHFPTGATS